MSASQKQSKFNAAQQTNELLRRIGELETIQQEEYDKMRTYFLKAREDLEFLNQRINELKDSQQHKRSPDLGPAEEKFNMLNRRFEQIFSFHQSQHEDFIFNLQQEKEKLKSLQPSPSFQNIHQGTAGRNNYLKPGREPQQNQNRVASPRGAEGGKQPESDLNKELISSQRRIDEMEEKQNQEHQRMRSDWKDVEKDYRDVEFRIQQIEITQRNQHEISSAEKQSKEEEMKEKLQRSAAEQEDLTPLQLREMAEELKNTRAALKHKEEELQSFKDRVAADITPSIKTGDRMMSLNSPVSKSRLTEMYETLRCDWLDIKVNLKSNGKKPEAVGKLIKESFLKAKTQMEEKKTMISKVFDLDKSKHGTEHPKIKEYMLLTVQNLQMALYYQKHGPTLQEVKEPKEMMDGLGSRCYWLGCLMALSDPPIQPDWDHHPPSMDKWDILPRNVVASEKSSSSKTTSCVV